MFAHRSLTVSSLIAHECWIPCCTVTARSTRRAAECCLRPARSRSWLRRLWRRHASGAPAEPPLPVSTRAARCRSRTSTRISSRRRRGTGRRARRRSRFTSRQPVAQENEQIGTTLGDADDGDTLAIVTVTGIGDDSVAARRTSVVLQPDGDGWRLVRAQWTQRCQLDRGHETGRPSPASDWRVIRPRGGLRPRHRRSCRPYALALRQRPNTRPPSVNPSPKVPSAKAPTAIALRHNDRPRQWPIAAASSSVSSSPRRCLRLRAAGLQAEVEIVEDLGAVGHHPELYSLVRLVPASRTDTRPVVAAFDVDGTLTTGDRVTPFLWRVARWRLARTIARHPFGIAGSTPARRQRPAESAGHGSAGGRRVRARATGGRAVRAGNPGLHPPCGHGRAATQASRARPSSRARLCVV